MTVLQEHAQVVQPLRDCYACSAGWQRMRTNEKARTRRASGMWSWTLTRSTLRQILLHEVIFVFFVVVTSTRWYGVQLAPEDSAQNHWALRDCTRPPVFDQGGRYLGHGAEPCSNHRVIRASGTAALADCAISIWGRCCVV